MLKSYHNTIMIGDCRQSMREMIAAGVKVQCVVTSPPYWGLRNYGVPPTIWGGDPACAHEWGEEGRIRRTGGTAASTLGSDHHANGLNPETIAAKVARSSVIASTDAFCAHCGAWKGDLGLEPTPWMWLAHLVEVFDLVLELLADDGTLWLNLGDCHASDGGVLTPHSGLPPNRRVTQSAVSGAVRWRTGSTGNKGNAASAEVICRPSVRPDDWLEVEQGAKYRLFFEGVKQKDMLGTHWAAALALRAAGYWLRSDIIWHKKNPMPGSYKDRPTTTHEYLFLLAKSDRYFYDWEAIAEACSTDTHPRTKMSDGWDTGEGRHGRFHRKGREKGEVKRAPGVTPKSAGLTRETGIRSNESFHTNHSGIVQRRNKRTVWTIGTEPYKEAHFATFPTKLVEPCILAGSRPGDIVFDPFMGSGTVAQVATRLGRQFLGCELNSAYEPMQKRRVAQPGLVLV